MEKRGITPNTKIKFYTTEIIMNGVTLKQYNGRRHTLIGEDLEEGVFYKVEVEHNPNKNYDIKGEYEILLHLNDKKCRSAPLVYYLGTISKEDLLSKMELEEEKEYIRNLNKEEFNFIAQQYVPHEEGYTLADVIFSIIEQKSLSVYHGDIKPANIRYNPNAGICMFVDYDQSIMLSKEGEDSDILPFIDFCDDYDKEKYDHGDWLRHFSNFDKKDIPQYFNDEGAFNLAETSIYKNQCTTNAQGGVYHTISHKDIFANGVRTMEERSKLLDKVEFSKDERVLDIGCNSGLLSFYLHSRGCRVTGVDNDKFIPIAAKMVANIIGAEGIQFFQLDLDEKRNLLHYDTVMLFSVLHHTKDPKGNARKIAEKCNRIIIESRLTENGKQPSGGVWHNTSRWEFESLEKLTSFYEEIFPGFRLKSNLGKADKNRYLLEFVK